LFAIKKEFKKLKTLAPPARRQNSNAACETVATFADARAVLSGFWDFADNAHEN
jgi:hypothetical protein